MGERAFARVRSDAGFLLWEAGGAEALDSTLLKGPDFSPNAPWEKEVVTRSSSWERRFYNLIIKKKKLNQ